MDAIQVLVVEDDELIRMWLEGVLDEGGYTPLVLSYGEEAVALLEANEPVISALITDVNLGDGKLTGWDVARRAREITPTLPVIYSTGGNTQQWASLGVPNSVLLQKPFAESQLITAVSQLLVASSTLHPPATE